MSDSLTLRVLHPRILTSNQRLHWAERNETVQILKEQAMLMARAKSLRCWDRCRIDVDVAMPDLSRRRDAMNLADTLKAQTDGLVAAGIIPDDDWTHLDGPHPHITGRLVDPTPFEVALKQRPWEFTYRFSAWEGPQHV